MAKRWSEWQPGGARVRSLGMLAALAAFFFAASAQGVVATPTVTGPITSPGSAFLTPPTSLDLASSATSRRSSSSRGPRTAYTSADPLGTDGKWTATPADTADYKTRIVVRPPDQSEKVQRHASWSSG